MTDEENKINRLKDQIYDLKQELKDVTDIERQEEINNSISQKQSEVATLYGQIHPELEKRLNTFWGVWGSGGSNAFLFERGLESRKEAFDIIKTRYAGDRKYFASQYYEKDGKTFGYY